MTPVDALDTLTLMGLKPQADEAREVIDTKLNLDQDIYVKDFEITIRLLGSLVSCYEMTGDKRLLELADDLGRRMLPMFDSPTGMPYEYVNLHTGAVRGNEEQSGGDRYIADRIRHAGEAHGQAGVLRQGEARGCRAVQEAVADRPGRLGDRRGNRQMERSDGGHHGRDRFYYEYLLKASILFDDKDCARMWQDSANAIDKYLSDERPDGLWYGQADMNSGKRTNTFYGALDAFFPAVLALGDDVHRAGQLQDSSYRMWNLAGIEPEQLDYVKMEITGPGYELRPEIIESTYYLYHYTHNPKYLAMGKAYFDGLVKYCRTDEGYAALADVRSKKKKDSMESFFFAETLKYLYLLFAPESTLDFDSVIFNTEAHPMKRSLGLKAGGLNGRTIPLRR